MTKYNHVQLRRECSVRIQGDVGSRWTFDAPEFDLSGDGYVVRIGLNGRFTEIPFAAVQVAYVVDVVEPKPAPKTKKEPSSGR